MIHCEVLGEGKWEGQKRKIRNNKNLGQLHKEEEEDKRKGEVETN